MARQMRFRANQGRPAIWRGRGMQMHLLLVATSILLLLSGFQTDTVNAGVKQAADQEAQEAERPAEPPSLGEREKLSLSIFEECMLRLKCLAAQKELKRLKEQLYRERPRYKYYELTLRKLQNEVKPDYQRKLDKVKTYFQTFGGRTSPEASQYRQLVQLWKGEYWLQALNENEYAMVFDAFFADQDMRNFIAEDMEKKRPELAKQFDLGVLEDFREATLISMEQETERRRGEAERMELESVHPQFILDMAREEGERAAFRESYRTFVHTTRPENVRAAIQREYELSKQFRELHRSNRKWVWAMRRQEAIPQELPDTSEVQEAEFSQDYEPLVAVEAFGEDLDEDALLERTTRLVEELKEEMPLDGKDTPRHLEAIEVGIESLTPEEEAARRGLGDYVWMGIYMVTGLLACFGIVLLFIRHTWLSR